MFSKIIITNLLKRSITSNERRLLHTLLTRQCSKSGLVPLNSSLKETLSKQGVLYNLNGKRLVATNEKPAAKKSLIVIQLLSTLTNL